MALRTQSAAQASFEFDMPGLDQAQKHRLSHKFFPNDVLETIKSNIDATALKNGFLSFVKHTTDLFQTPLSKRLSTRQ